MIAVLKQTKYKIASEHIFMLSALIVNGGNYLYNLILGRVLGPEKFADAAIIITFLLVLSFLAMTFQLVTAKFAVIFEGESYSSFISKMYKGAAITSIVLGVLIIYFSTNLQNVFKTSSSLMFVIFGIGVPFYFLMSVNRGVFQGKKELLFLSGTYQMEMISRLILTFTLLYFLKIESSVIISLGVLGSFLFGLFPFRTKNISLKKTVSLNDSQAKAVRSFFIITVFYELTQIIINNSDILLVKHYFSSYDAGLYASLALIGRVVYFIAWMFVMILLPVVVKLKKEGKPTKPILFKYVSYIGVITAIIISVCFLFPEQVIRLLFGDSYLGVNALLWKYALATGVFAVSNIFTYYYLSLDKYIPVVFSGVFGIAQIALIVQFHSSINQVIMVQVYVMTLLLVLQLLYFLATEGKSKIQNV
ncbi:oligosaccharide flippase family protein [Tenacibaculum sp. MEBiC06402]|uniref:oligosaccharide flippase family protein n=1 Tax=unclassified Tenacibaculum TaxID=2635139 RepID=UPI003B9CB981